MNLKKGIQNNNIPLTLQEKTTLDPVVYLFELQNDTTKIKYHFICQDVSPISTRERTNLFNITEGIDDPLNSKIILGNTGRYHLTVWEQLDPNNLDPNQAFGVVHRGTCNVFADEVSRYKAHEIIITYKAHEPY